MPMLKFPHGFPVRLATHEGLPLPDVWQASRCRGMETESKMPPVRKRASRRSATGQIVPGCAVPESSRTKKPSGSHCSYVYTQILVLRYLRPMRSLRCVASRTQSSRSLKSHGGQPWGETPKILQYASTIAGTGSSFKSSRALRFACSRSALILSSS